MVLEYDGARPVPLVTADLINLRALVFGCTCHNTTLGGTNLKICGEYAGYAQEELERQHPGAQAMFVIGCGSGSNPYPRGTVELARERGRALAEEVSRVSAGTLQPLGGPLRIAFGWADLPLAATADGERRAWHPITVSSSGPVADETLGRQQAGPKAILEFIYGGDHHGLLPGCMRPVLRCGRRGKGGIVEGAFA
jgi:hypothetical protein